MNTPWNISILNQKSWRFGSEWVSLSIFLCFLGEPMSIVFWGVKHGNKKKTPQKIADVISCMKFPPHFSTFPTRGNLHDLATEKAFSAKLLGLKGFTKQIPRLALHSTNDSHSHSSGALEVWMKLRVGGWKTLPLKNDAPLLLVVWWFTLPN